jgi:hypothetical protein
MPFPVLGSNSAVAGYEIDNSLRFNDGDSPKLTKTFGSAGTSVRTFTISFWVKKCLNGKVNDLCGVTNGLQFIFRSGDDLRINFFTPGTDFSDFITTQLFRDPSAWYHIVLAVDTTQGTEANRKKLYVNGSQVTSFATQNFPTQNRDLSWNSTAEHQIGYSAQSNNYSDIYLSDFNSVDGQALDPTYFGETNDNGVWIPKAYSGSYGTNGFKLEFQDSGNLGDDTSGNGNDFTATNLTATDQTTDTPTNNFATWNPLKERPTEEGNITLSEGNTKANGTSTYAYSNIAFPTSGKWYAEVKMIAGAGTAHVGLLSVDDFTVDGNSSRLFYRVDGQKDVGGTQSSYGASYTNSIISVAVNLDDNEVTFYKDGVSQGTLSHNASNQYLISAHASSYTSDVNFGNPPFTISSGNADANGYGNFEYAVPSGYYALCTKNLAEYG